MNISRKVIAPWQEDDQLDTCLGDLSARLEAASGVCKAFGGYPEGSVDDPREQIAATVAGCFSMLLSGMLTKAGHLPTRLDTRGKVELCMQGKPRLSRVQLTLTATVPGITASTFDRLAHDASDMVARSLSAPPIVLESTLSV